MSDVIRLPERIAAASRKVGGALKADSRNKEYNYDYISADKILDIAGQALADNGVVIIPTITESHVDIFDRGAKGVRYDANVTFAFNIMGGEDAFTALWTGRGSDYTVPDKAIYKAITSGHKYFLAKLLNIGEGNEDSEHDNPEPTAQPKPRPEQVITAELGYDAPPATMTLETAKAVTNSDGVPYGEIDSESLSNMTIGIGRALNKPNLTPEQRNTYAMKQDAIKVILTSRNQ